MIRKTALTGIFSLCILGCTAPEKQREFQSIPGETVKNLVLKVLTDRGYSIQQTDFRDFVVSATSKRTEDRGIFGSNGFTWNEVTVIAREYQSTPIRVDLLVQIQVWRQPPIGQKEMVKNSFTNDRLEGEKALEQLDLLVAKAKNLGR